MFIDTSLLFNDLQKEEKQRLIAQHNIMGELINILTERIEYFLYSPVPKQTEGRVLIGDFGVDNRKIFNIKQAAARYLDTIIENGVAGRRLSKAKTDIETSCMYAVKSIFEG